MSFREASFDGHTVLAVEARRYVRTGLILVVIIILVVMMAAQRHQEVIEQVAGNLHSLHRAHVARVAEMNAPQMRASSTCPAASEKRSNVQVNPGYPGALRVKVCSSPSNSASVLMNAVVITA